MPPAATYGAAPPASDVELGADAAQHPKRASSSAWTTTRRVAVGLAAVAGVLGVSTLRSSASLRSRLDVYEAPLPEEKTVPGTATFTLDANCIDDAPTTGAHQGFFTSPITGAAIVRHNYQTTGFFKYEDKIPMNALGNKKFSLTTDQVDWEWSFVLENARGEFLYEAGQEHSPLFVTAQSETVPTDKKSCIQNYGLYWNRVRTKDFDVGSPSYTFGTCDRSCPPPPPPAPVKEAEAPTERTSTPPMVQPTNGGRVSLTIDGNPGAGSGQKLQVGQFGAIATAYGDTVQKEVRAVSWYAFKPDSRSVNVHSIDKTYNQIWKQEAKVTYMFTLQKLVEKGAVATIGTEAARLGNDSQGGLKIAGPWSYDYASIGAQKPLIFCTTWTPHSYPDTFVPNVYNLDASSGKFTVGVSRVDSPWTTRYGWGDSAIVVSYVAFGPDAQRKAPEEILALGELKVPMPSAADQTYSAVTLTHNLGTTAYKCLATIRQDVTQLTRDDRTIGVECQAATANTVTLMTMDVGYRDWSSTAKYRYADKVYVQYMLLPDIGAPVIDADYFSGTPQGNVK